MIGHGVRPYVTNGRIKADRANLSRSTFNRISL
jgi:hypothetical protein